MQMRDKVQEYFDGELDADERARFEAEMTADDRERLAALAEMRALLNGALEADAGEVDIWSGVSKQLQRERARRGWRRSRLFGGAATMFLAAAAAFIFFLHPWHPRHPENDCDVESLEVDGAFATVLQIQDAPHEGDGNTTIIWTEED
jgi:anti-sigma factor RsiW